MLLLSPESKGIQEVLAATIEAISEKDEMTALGMVGLIFIRTATSPTVSGALILWAVRQSDEAKRWKLDEAEVVSDRPRVCCPPILEDEF